MREHSPYAIFDLHLHTHWSYDATAGAESYFKLAVERGVRCIALTDHHNVDGAEESREVAERYPSVRLVAAAELTVSHPLGCFDLVCYGLPREPAGSLAKVLDDYHNWQRAYGKAISSGLQALGYDYSDTRRLEVLQTYRPQKILDRQGATHVRYRTQREAFHTFGFTTDAGSKSYADLLSHAKAAVPTPPYPSYDKVAPAVREAGGLVVIAHPKGYFQDANLDRMDRLRIELTLDGIECAHPSTPPELTAIYRQYCVRHGLVSTGGSDCHDLDHLVPQAPGYTANPRFACHLGEEHWLDEFLARLDANPPT